MMRAPADKGELDRGRAGASARRTYGRRRAKREKHPRIGGFLLAMQADPVKRWVIGAEGEESVQRALRKHCASSVRMLHDRRVMAPSSSNIDHIGVAPSGVWVIDTKRHDGKVAVSRPLFGQAKLTIRGRDRSRLVDGLDNQVSRVTADVREVAPGVPVHGALCFVDSEVPLLMKLTINGYRLMYPKQLASP